MELTAQEKAFLQTIENTKIAFNILKHFSDESEKKEGGKYHVVNLQYSMKYLYEQIERMGREWEYHKMRKDPNTPLNSTVRGALTAEQAMAIIKGQAK